MPDLEAVLQTLVDLKSAQRATNWSIADAVASLVVDGRSGSPAAGKCAEVLGCSSAWVKKLARVSRTFDADHRYPDVGFGLYVVATRAEDPVEALEAAVHDGLSVTGLEQMLRIGKVEQERCPTCGKARPKAA